MCETFPLTCHLPVTDTKAVTFKIRGKRAFSLNFLPLLGGGRADLKPREEDLVTMPPHDEGTHGTDQRLSQVEDDLDQEVQRKCPCNPLAVTDFLIDEGASDGVLLIQHAHAAPSFLLTGEAAGL